MHAAYKEFPTSLPTLMPDIALHPEEKARIPEEWPKEVVTAMKRKRRYHWSHPWGPAMYMCFLSFAHFPQGFVLTMESPFCCLLLGIWRALALNITEVVANVAVIDHNLQTSLYKKHHSTTLSCYALKFISILMHSVPPIGCSPPMTGCSRILMQTCSSEIVSFVGSP